MLPERSPMGWALWMPVESIIMNCPEYRHIEGACFPFKFTESQMLSDLKMSWIQQVSFINARM
jgi:hypothetical protein